MQRLTRKFFREMSVMLGLLKPCEPPVHHFWHLVSGVAVLALAWAMIVIASHWLF